MTASLSRNWKEKGLGTPWTDKELEVQEEVLLRPHVKVLADICLLETILANSDVDPDIKPVFASRV